VPHLTHVVLMENQCSKIVIVVTDRHIETHTDTQTNVGENIFLAFAGDNKQ